MAQTPHDLIGETMLRLPVKSLLRFKCLSKSLCAHINSPDFINSHLSKCSRNFNLHKLIFSDLTRMIYHVCDVNADLKDEILLLKNPFLSVWKRVGGKCNGLLLLYRNSHPMELALWNPSTRQHRDLPSCPLKGPVNVEYKVIALGFGYDDSVDDYKTVIIVDVYPKLETEVQVWIYGLKSNTWRRTQNFPHHDYPIYLGGDVEIGYFADGCVRWFFVMTKTFCVFEIVEFVVRKETFSLFHQPVPTIITNVGISVRFHVLEGCFGISYITSCRQNEADLYMRKKDGIDQFTWTTRLFLSINGGTFSFVNMEVLGYSKIRDKILLNLSTNCMVWYDLKEENFTTVENVKVLGCSKEEDEILLNLITNPSWYAPIFCHDSLVSIGV